MSGNDQRNDTRADENGLGPGVTSVPLLSPRIFLASASTLVALMAPLVFAPLIAITAGFVLWRTRSTSQGDPFVSAVSIGLGLLAMTLLITPVWLTLLAGVGRVEAIQVAGALALRLSAVFLVGYAFATVVRPVQWLVSLQRFPRLALALTLTFRQVPEFKQDAVQLRAAQQGRGLLVGHRRWRPLVFLVPLFSRAVERADRASMALILCSWGQGRARPAHRARRTPADTAIVVGGLLMIALVFLPVLGW